MFSVCPHLGGSVQPGGVRSVQPGEGQVSPARGRSGQSSQGGQVSPGRGWGGRSGQSSQWGESGQSSRGGVSQLRGGSAKIGQQNEYSLHGGRYASSVHAGGLSCFEMHCISEDPLSTNKEIFTLNNQIHCRQVLEKFCTSLFIRVLPNAELTS